ncbi:MAG: hypothetical protein RLZZ529_1062 [Bacteroidota bacterium]|jgi:hypothetical protein
MIVLYLIIKYSDSKKITLVNLQKNKTHDKSDHKRNTKPKYIKI